MASEHYTPETIQVYRQMFQSKDKDGSGTLDATELEQCLQLCGLIPTKEDVTFLTKHFDTNGDGKLQIEELLENMHILNEHSVSRDELMAAFKMFDKDGSGFIRLPELLKILTVNDFMTPDDASKFLRHLTDKYDTDKDGKFNYAEFVAMYNDAELMAQCADSNS